jgi:hypothetical protein
MASLALIFPSSTMRKMRSFSLSGWFGCAFMSASFA